MNAIEVSNLTKVYKTFRLDNVSFNVQTGRIVGFIGRNGAGKTTTIKSILNIVKIDNGNVNFFEMDMKQNENIIKNQIGYASGTTNYYPRKRLNDIIDITKMFYQTWDDQVMIEYQKIFQLDFSKTPSELSEGMKVKFNLLLALSHHAKVLILDEPTSGLDPFSRDEILEVFMELKKRGVAILFSTHITSDLEKCADDIVYISKGKIINSSTKDDFIRKYRIGNESLESIILRLERENHD